ncbi:hypothetical protein L6452_05173 [Arctium lappa]|uniref:Uncharacterized protein n=1 Tax=Arctium lappa TaxID=4217 RepID=A0ACB9EGR1_ARCLA|nr:hypothetical protein L6452_05173 [Arctium lappa]
MSHWSPSSLMKKKYVGDGLPPRSRNKEAPGTLFFNTLRRRPTLSPPLSLINPLPHHHHYPPSSAVASKPSFPFRFLRTTISPFVIHFLLLAPGSKQHVYSTTRYLKVGLSALNCSIPQQPTLLKCCFSGILISKTIFHSNCHIGIVKVNRGRFDSINKSIKLVSLHVLYCSNWSHSCSKDLLFLRHFTLLM